MKANNRLCPVCSSEKKAVLAPIEFTLFDGHPMNGGYDLVQCANCGFVFADTSVTQQQLDSYYTELSKYEDKTISTGGGYDQNDRDRLRDAALLLSSKIDDKGARMLDLGCANGGLLRELKNLGFENLVGIDPSSVCVEAARIATKCDVFQYSLFSIPKEIGKFDVVILSHVLEHVLDVGRAIDIIDNLLSDGGCVYLECPNAACYYQVIHAPLQEFNSEHINHFSELSFRNLMLVRGYEEVLVGDKVFKIASNQDYHAVYGIFRKCEGAIGQPIIFDHEISKAIQRYVQASNNMFTEISEQLEAMPEDVAIALYGVGQFSFKLLSMKTLKNRSNIKLFDNNKVNVGKVIRGAVVLHGDKLLEEYRKESFTVIISSLIHEAPIRRNIEIKFGELGYIPTIIGFSKVLESTD
jgi:2-polyprenyl-3-methyl-5-hydroxy-6-metoxy-1,4-benzoquinol methylase